MKLNLIAGALAIGLALPAAAQMRGPQGPQTRAEFQAAQKAQFDGFDTNKDGVVTKDEIAAAIAARMGNTPAPQMIDGVFARIDTNGDGKATAAEADAAAMMRFDMWDANKDGTLTPEERRAGMMAMRQQ